MDGHVWALRVCTIDSVRWCSKLMCLEHEYVLEVLPRRTLSILFIMSVFGVVVLWHCYGSGLG